MSVAPLILSACGGFLLAVLWFDLMFDVQILRHRERELPEPVLSSIAAYYLRVTTTAQPMGALIAVVMLAAIVTLVAEIVRDDGRRLLAVVSLLVGGAPIALAAVRTVPNAMRLGSRSGSILEQSLLARSICRDHVIELIAVVAFLALQLLAL
jgi:hypothetical protein